LFPWFTLRFFRVRRSARSFSSAAVATSVMVPMLGAPPGVLLATTAAAARWKSCFERSGGGMPAACSGSRGVGAGGAGGSRGAVESATVLAAAAQAADSSSSSAAASLPAVAAWAAAASVASARYAFAAASAAPEASPAVAFIAVTSLGSGIAKCSLEWSSLLELYEEWNVEKAVWSDGVV
jgi:hypothetical protein